MAEATDGGGAVDVAAMEIPAGTLPAHAVLQAFDETHLEARDELVAIGDALTIAGFPLGFQDTIHHLAVARSASIASAYGVRFQRQGCFLTDARTHRGSSGSPSCAGAPTTIRRLRHRPGSCSACTRPAWICAPATKSRMNRSG